MNDLKKTHPRTGRYRRFDRVILVTPDPSKTKQSFRDECDINTIMAKYRATGILDHVQIHKGRYEDLPSEIDYHADVLAVMAAQDAFASLPAAIRARFENDPAKFVGFVQDPENQEEIDEMGLGQQSMPAPPAPAPSPEPEPAPIAES